MVSHRYRSTVAYLILSAALLFGLYRIHEVSVNLDEQANRNTAALCAFRANIYKDRNASIAYLKIHPRGVISPVTNAVIISAAQIRSTIDRQALTLRALQGLRC